MSSILYSGHSLCRRSISGRPCSNSPSDAAWNHTTWSVFLMWRRNSVYVCAMPTTILRAFLLKMAAKIMAHVKRYSPIEYISRVFLLQTSFV